MRPGCAELSCLSLSIASVRVRGVSGRRRAGSLAFSLCKSVLCSGFGTLPFALPLSVTGFQPLDLCNPARTLLLSEELLLYEGRNKTSQVRPACAAPLETGWVSSLPMEIETASGWRPERLPKALPRGYPAVYLLVTTFSLPFSLFSPL